MQGDLDFYVVDAGQAKINALIFGLPGVGKTTFASTAQLHPKMRDVLFLNLEGGLLSVASRHDITALDIRNVDQLEEILGLIAQEDPRFERFQTIVLDSASELQVMSLQHDIIHRQSGNRNRDLNDINISDYGRTSVRLGRLLRMLRDLPRHTIITALPVFTYPEGERGGAPSEVAPAFTPRLRESVIGYFDFVWYMYQDGEGKRFILTKDQGAYRSKTRGENFPTRLGPKFEAPTLPVLLDLLIECEGAEHQGATRPSTALAMAPAVREHVVNGEGVLPDVTNSSPVPDSVLQEYVDSLEDAPPLSVVLPGADRPDPAISAPVVQRRVPVATGGRPVVRPTRPASAALAQARAQAIQARAEETTTS